MSKLILLVLLLSGCGDYEMTKLNFNGAKFENGDKTIDLQTRGRSVKIIFRKTYKFY